MNLQWNLLCFEVLIKIKFYISPRFFFVVGCTFSLTLIGWGKEKNSDDLKLTQINVAIRSKQFCNFKLNKTKHEGSRQTFLRIDLFLPDLLKDTQFCADTTTLTDEERTINGDSGGPSVQR